jgi:hypothetical protein
MASSTTTSSTSAEVLAALATFDSLLADIDGPSAAEVERAAAARREYAKDHGTEVSISHFDSLLTGIDGASVAEVERAAAARREHTDCTVEEVLSVGELVDYKASNGQAQQAQIVAVHTDEMPFYYTISVEGSERSTERSRLSRRAPASADPPLGRIDPFELSRPDPAAASPSRGHSVIDPFESTLTSLTMEKANSIDAKRGNQEVDVEDKQQPEYDTPVNVGLGGALD